MGGKPIPQNIVWGGNGMGGETGTSTSPIAGQQQDTAREITGWLALTEAVKCFGLAAITQWFSKKLLKWQADVEWESTKCATFKIQAVEAANLQVFVGMLKEDAEL